MRKIAILLVLLSIFALPAIAAVTITADCANGVYVVSYTTDANIPRAFALDIQVATGTITAVGSLSADYDIYPGSIVIVDGEVSDAGSAVCDSSYPDTLGGIGTAGITIEMGSLYAEGEPAPATSGVLFTFTLSDIGAVVMITENVIRGGIVMENPEEAITPTITVNGCCCPRCPMDLDGDGWITPNDLGMIMVFLTPYAAEGYEVECFQ